MDLRKEKLCDAIENEKPFVFLSSLCIEIIQERSQIYDSLNTPNNGLIPIYVDEKYNNRDTTPILEKQLQSADDLTSLIAKSKYLIILFTKIYNRNFDHGSIFEGSMVSFWEIELFYAAIEKKPIYAIVERGFENQNRPFLMHRLDILKLSAISVQYVDNIKEIPSKVEALVSNPPKTNFLNSQLYLSKLFEKRKSKYSHIDTIYDGSLASSNWASAKNEINEDLISATLDNILSIKNYQQRITRLYLPYKELLKAPYDDKRYQKFLKQWNTLSSDFSGALSWSGVFGHQVLGVVTQLNDLVKIRKRIRETPIKNDFNINEIEHPFGALASSYYSLSKNVYFPKNLILLYRDIKTLNRGVAESAYDKSGLLAIRGSCFFRLGNPFYAQKDYEKSYKLKLEEKNDIGTIADIESELAFAYFYSLKRQKGIDLWEKAIEKFKDSEDTGFKIRAYRKGAKMYNSLNKKSKAEECLKEAERISNLTSAYDQKQQIKK